jgi:integrase
MRFLEWAEVEELAANTAAPYGNMVMLAALTGLRQGELFALRDRNVDVDAKILIVENGVYKGEFPPSDARLPAARRPLDESRPRPATTAARAPAERPWARLPLA